MRTIDLQDIIDKLELDPKELAQHLFPGHTHPKLALNRVLAKKGLLDADQISLLSSFTGLTVDQVYGADWKIKNTNNICTFSYKDFKAELNTQTWLTKIFHKKSLFHESIIHGQNIPLSKYLEKLNSIITKYQNNEQS